jgi:predicted transposase/invertase (TIGR01784 family)
MQTTKHDDAHRVLGAFYNEGWGYGHSEGYSEGLEEGIEIGREESTLAIARKMKAIGRPESEIAEVTGLTVDEVNNC